MPALALAAPLRSAPSAKAPTPPCGPDRAASTASPGGSPAPASRWGLGLYLSSYWPVPSTGSDVAFAKFQLGSVQLIFTPGVMSALSAGLGAAGAAGFARFISGNDGRTAWDPPGTRDIVFWLPGGILFLLLSLAGGLYDGLIQALIDGRADQGQAAGALVWAQWFGACLILGMTFLVEGLIDGSTRHLRQRRAAGQRDGGQWQPEKFKYALSFLGPLAGLWLLMQAIRMLQGRGRLRAGLRGACSYSPGSPCCGPAGRPSRSTACCRSARRAARTRRGRHRAGLRPGAPGRASHQPGSDAPHPGHPPLAGARRAGRIEDLDDPVRPVDPPQPPARPPRAGRRRFEPDPVTRRPQTRVITVRLRAPDDVTTLSGGDIQSRRIVVLRPFPVGDARRGQQSVTYRWDDDRLPPGSIQVVDATTRELQLRDGDVLVLSSEGIARAYAIEIGEPLYTWGPLSTSRPPQVEDYTAP